MEKRHLTKDMPNDLFAWKKKRKKSRDCLTRDPGKNILSLGVRNLLWALKTIKRSCSKQPFSGCLKAEVNLPVYLPFERPAAILTRATLNSTGFTDLLPYRGIYIPSILHLQG